MNNPFADLTALLPPLFMQVYVVLMALAVIAGTLLDVSHKRSGEYFALHRKKRRKAATRELDAGTHVVLAASTLAYEVAAAGELAGARRASHLLMFYGFIAYVVATVVMAFAYATDPQTPLIWPVLWNIGAVMALIGGGWFFFALRVDVAHERHSPFHLVRADLFILSLLLSVAFALIWEGVQAAGNPIATAIFFGVYLFFTTLLFVSVPWSKFAHMFYKPVMAYQRKVEEADGSTNLPAPAKVNELRS